MKFMCMTLAFTDFNYENFDKIYCIYTHTVYINELPVTAHSCGVSKVLNF